ncbi:MAG: DUF4159 domain-containing protein [Acidobacteria bacterium]|nr:DUF4159 domain-containing protein [Acidobacteriota bacterium]
MTPLLRTLVLLLLIAATATAQEQWYRGYGRGFNRVPPRLPTTASYDGGFSFCRGMFSQWRREASGSGWSTDYPDADVNFSIRFAELTKVWVSKQPTGDPNHLVVPLTDDFLFNCPNLHMEDVGTLRFSDQEVPRVREYLQKGGFIWVDDSWGPEAIESWEHEIARVLPADEYPILDLPLDHPVFRTMFQIRRLPQIPAISHWRRSGGGTSERDVDSEVPVMRGISDRQGNLMVLMTHNTDISDAWEREAEDPEYFYRFSPDGYAVGLNIVLYAMSH